VISDPGSTRVKAVTRLSQKDARQETGLFLLEGPQGLKELTHYPEMVHEIFVTESAATRYAQELDLLRNSKTNIEVVSDRVIEKLSETQTPQGIVAVVHQLHIDLADLVEASPKLVVLLERIQDPGNAGTILRAADAAGCDGVVFSAGSVDVYNGKVVRSTAGSLLHVPVVVGADLASAIKELQKIGMQVLLADVDGEPLPQIPTATLSKPTAWIFGNEANGADPALRAIVDKVVSIPIYGSAESLNLATAASICLYSSAFAQAAGR
jgi:TrmH family RNA methyltransferase